MSNSAHPDPAERRPFLRFFYRDWRPTRLGRWANRLARWSSDHGISSGAVLEVRGRASGEPRSIPVVIATLGDERYLVSMLGPESDWVKNVEAAHGEAVIREHGRHPVHLVGVPSGERAPIISEYVQVATSGREHIPVAVDAPLAEFEAISDRYPVYRIDPS